MLELLTGLVLSLLVIITALIAALWRDQKEGNGEIKRLIMSLTAAHLRRHPEDATQILD